MKHVVEDVVERLSATYTPSARRLIAAADLTSPVEMEPEPEVVTAPFQWLLRAVGDGIRPTPGGFLPVAVTTEGLQTLGWHRDWMGTRYREDTTPPIRWLRACAQDAGLLRKQHGVLLPTAAGRRLADDPDGLWRWLAERLPSRRIEVEGDATVLYLLAVAARVDVRRREIANGLWLLGWRYGAGHERINEGLAYAAAIETSVIFQLLGLAGHFLGGGSDDGLPTEAGVRFARAILLGPLPASRSPRR